MVQIYSKTTFVTVNLSKSDPNFGSEKKIQKQLLLLLILDTGRLKENLTHSKTTFVTVNPSFLKALYFII